MYTFENHVRKFHRALLVGQFAQGACCSLGCTLADICFGTRQLVRRFAGGTCVAGVSFSRLARCGGTIGACTLQSLHLLLQSARQLLQQAVLTAHPLQLTALLRLL